MDAQKRDVYRDLMVRLTGKTFNTESSHRFFETTAARVLRSENVGVSLREKPMVLPERIELSTSPLPRECSTPELRQPSRWL